jgi:hypothetical protein
MKSDASRLPWAFEEADRQDAKEMYSMRRREIEDGLVEGFRVVKPR